jgi:hypothetical protein
VYCADIAQAAFHHKVACSNTNGKPANAGHQHTHAHTRTQAVVAWSC